MKKQAGFTLIEMMIVIAIVGILAAIAFPIYTDYLVRGKVSEAVMLLAGTKHTSVEYYHNVGEWPPSADVITSRLGGRYTTGLTAGGSYPMFYMEISMRPEVVQVAGQQLRLIYDAGDGNWRCTTMGTTDPIPDKFLPASCR